MEMSLIRAAKVVTPFSFHTEIFLIEAFYRYVPQRQRIYLWTCIPSEDSDQTAQMRSLIRIFTGRILDS